MTKFQKYYRQMWDENKDILSRFQMLHDQYKEAQRNPEIKKQFDEIGSQARTIMEAWDQRLCNQMEKGKNALFSTKVSEKFWNEIKQDFPLVDFVGVEVSFQ